MRINMKKLYKITAIYLLLVFVLSAAGVTTISSASAQVAPQYGYNKNWILGGLNQDAFLASLFGFDAVLKPVLRQENSGFMVSRGAASISDSEGRLLLYTNGMYIYNKNFQPVDDGNINQDVGVGFSFAQSQSSLIVRDPGNSNLFYVFTVPPYTESLSNEIGLRYSVVDVSFNNGQGRIIQKNVLLDPNVNSRVAATYHSNGTELWVVSHRQGNNQFVAYKLTSSGIQTTPIISSVGSAVVGKNRIGVLKFSPNSQKLVSLLGDPDNLNTTSLANVELFDFDNSSGLFSNAVNLANNGEVVGTIDCRKVKGAEFSQNSTMLYVTANAADLLQFNISLQSSNIKASGNAIYKNSTVTDGFSLPQIGADGIIYLHTGRISDNKVGAIFNTDTYGSGCSFVTDYISLPYKLRHLGVWQNTVQYPIPSYPNRPPVPVGLPSNNTIIVRGGPVDYTLEFYSPEQGQITSISTNLSTSQTSGFQILSNTGGSPARISFRFTANGSNSGTHTFTVTGTDNGNPVASTTVELTLVVYRALCKFTIPKAGGSFVAGNQSGTIVYQRNDNCSSQIVFGCGAKKNNLPAIPMVIASQAVTYADYWPYNATLAYGASIPASANVYERGLFGKWRAQSTYVYNSPTQGDKNYNRGTYQLQYFNWAQAESNGSNWIKQSTTTQYSPHGPGVEEVNLLGIASTAKFGFYGAVPYLTAQNAKHASVLFESFEMKYPGTQGERFEDGFTISSGAVRDGTTAHSGKYSLKWSSTSLSLPQTHSRDYNKGVLVKVWVKVAPLKRASLANDLRLNITEFGIDQPVTVVAQVGEWSLCQVYASVSSGGSFVPRLSYSGGGILWLDDLRLQPVDAQMSCYVYDESNLRLLAVLDDQHFALLYQYNSEGKLVRKKLETERGIQTLQETHYNTAKQ
jgi:hypothetical protein